MHERPTEQPDVKTTLSCEMTSGYNTKPFAWMPDFCPFCGHSTEGEGHTVELTVL